MSIKDLFTEQLNAATIYTDEAIRKNIDSGRVVEGSDEHLSLLSHVGEKMVFLMVEGVRIVEGNDTESFHELKSIFESEIEFEMETLDKTHDFMGYLTNPSTIPRFRFKNKLENA